MATYYLDPAGDDGNDGLSPATPITAANGYSRLLSLLQPGDTVLFLRGGTFPGGLVLDGLAGVTLDAYGGGQVKPVLAAGDGCGVLFHNSTGAVRNLHVCGSGVSSGGTTTSRRAAVEFVNSDTAGMLDGVTIQDCDLEHCYAGFEVRGYAPGQGTTPGAGSGYKNVSVSRVLVRDCAMNGGRVACIPLTDGNGNPITPEQYDLYATYPTQANNYLIARGQMFGNVSVDRLVVQRALGDPTRPIPLTPHTGDGLHLRNVDGGLVSRVVAMDCGAHGRGPAANWLQQCKDVVIELCASWDTGSSTTEDGDAFDMDDGCVNCTVRYCMSAQNAGAAVLCGPADRPGDIPAGCSAYGILSVGDCTNGTLQPINPYGGATLSTHDILVLPYVPLAPPAPPSNDFTQGWQEFPIPGVNGSHSVTSGTLTLSGSRFGTVGTFAAPSAIEFTATFDGGPYQHAGLGLLYDDLPWAIFSTSGGDQLRAATSNTVTQLSSSLLGSPHRYRVEWTADTVTYSVDGALVAQHPAPQVGAMRPLFCAVGGTLVVTGLVLTLP